MRKKESSRGSSGVDVSKKKDDQYQKVKQDDDDPCALRDEPIMQRVEIDPLATTPTKPRSLSPWSGS